MAAEPTVVQSERSHLQGYQDPEDTQPQASQLNSPLSPLNSSESFAESLSLIESGSSTACPPNKSLRRRLGNAVGLSRSSSEYTLRCHVPEITRPVSEYHGYGKVAAYEDSDPSFLIYRKFGWLHNRILLHLQDELADLEGQLEDLDKWEALTGNPTKLVCRRLDDAVPEESERRALLKRCNDKLAEYDEILLRLQKKQALQRPTKRNQNSLYNLIDTSDSLLQSESQWIRQSDDLLALAHDADYGYFNSLLELSLRKLSKKFILAVFRTPRQKTRTGSDEHLTLISAERFDILLRILVTVFAAVLLLVPVLILWELQSTDHLKARRAGTYQLLTIFLFTMSFSACCSIFTKAKRQEVFAATAAYCAVLVVFLGNSSNVMAAATKT